MSKAQMTLSDLSLLPDRIISKRDNYHMHTINEFKAKLKVSKREDGNLSGEIDSLNLEWIETCDWFEFTNNKWTLKGTKPDKIDMYALNPSSNTFWLWNNGRYSAASIDAYNNAPPLDLKAAVAKARDTESDKVAKH